MHFLPIMITWDPSGPVFLYGSCIEPRCSVDFGFHSINVQYFKLYECNKCTILLGAHCLTGARRNITDVTLKNVISNVTLCAICATCYDTGNYTGSV